MKSSANNPQENDGVLAVGFVPNAFTLEECRRIIELSERVEPASGTLGKQKELRLSKRNSEVVFLGPDEDTAWIYQKMDASVAAANNFYEFDLSGFEPFQVATYGEGGHYDWHMDLGKGPNSIGKLGISLQLSSPNEYEGGNLEFRGGGAPPMAPRNIGTLIVFPSFMTHGVAPAVTRGVRRSLVAWFMDQPSDNPLLGP